MSFRKRPVFRAAIVLVVALVGLGIGFLVPETKSTPPYDSASEDQEDVARNKPLSNTMRSTINQQSYGLSRFDIQDRLQGPRIVSDGHDHVWLAWESRTTERHRTVFLASSTDGGQTFGEATPIRTTAIYEWDVTIRHRSAKRSSRMWPHLEYKNQELILSWVEADQNDPSQQILKCARSSDQGQSFGSASRLSTEAAVRPTFAGLAADESGQVATVWLDHRNGVQQPFAASTDTRIIEQLVYSGAGGQGICPCCDLDVILTPTDDTVVAFRNQVDGFRDIWVSVRPHGDAEFQPPFAIGDRRWQFNGCPHDGPSMAVVRDQLHVVWMDAHTGTQQVYRAQSQVGEWEFETTPIQTTDAVQGHASLSTDSQNLWIVWDQAGISNQPVRKAAQKTSVDSVSSIMLVTSTDQGQTWSSPVEISTTVDTLTSRPVLVSNAEHLTLAWTNLSENGKQIVVKTIHRDAAITSPEQIAQNAN